MITLRELAADAEAADAQLRRVPRWGRWRYNPLGPTPSLDYTRGRTVLYWIDLASCTTSAEVLDWVYQLHGKAWMRDRDVRDLLRAFGWLLHPQAQLCSWGQERGPIAVREVLARRFRGEAA